MYFLKKKQMLPSQQISISFQQCCLLLMNRLKNIFKSEEHKHIYYQAARHCYSCCCCLSDIKNARAPTARFAPQCPVNNCSGKRVYAKKRTPYRGTSSGLRGQRSRCLSSSLKATLKLKKRQVTQLQVLGTLCTYITALIL